MKVSLNILEKEQEIGQKEERSEGTGVNGYVVWKGKSLINGNPIVVIATGFSGKGSANVKTGNVIQTWILPDNGESPSNNVMRGKDESVCGDCIHRKENGWSTCYVTVFMGPNNIYRKYLSNGYPALPELMNVFKNRKVRLGSYGDPAAVPIEIWDKICENSAGWTGYTHQWRRCSPVYKKYLMASVETPVGLLKARIKGWKTFRIRNIDEPVRRNEFVCPASKEAGKRLTCAECMACSGGEWNGKTVTPVIIVHGSPINKLPKFIKMQRLMRNKKKYRALV